MKDEIRTARGSVKAVVDLRTRTKELAVRVVALYSALPKSAPAQVIGKQLLRSGTSVGANYRETTRARTNAEFVSKVEISLQELEESAYWLELLVETKLVSEKRLAPLQKEIDELTAILTTCARNVKSRGGK